MTDAPLMPATPDDVAAFLARRRTPRARATKKLNDVLGRLVAGEPPLDRLRTAWVLGSYARGAPEVGDIDLYMEIDEPRSRGRHALDAVYRRAHPYSEVVKALGCGSGSLVSIDVEPKFLDEGKPGDSTSIEPIVPNLGHSITADPFDPPPTLLWVRGDTIETARSRLAAIPEDPRARRYERTTTVPLLDDLLPQLGVDTAFLLAMQIRRSNVALEATLLQPAEAPLRTRRALDGRYSEDSSRRNAAAAALSHLEHKGVELNAVKLIDGPASDRGQRRANEDNAYTASVDFNAFHLYRLGGGGYPTGWRHMHVWPHSRPGPWLALEALVLNSDRASELHLGLHTWDKSPDDRAAEVRKILYG